MRPGIHHRYLAPVLLAFLGWTGIVHAESVDQPADAAVDIELAPGGCYVLDRFGGLHGGGGAAALSPMTPYFGIDIARDLELK